MKYTTLALLCCGALLTACDSSNDATGEAEPGLLDKANSLATDTASMAKDVAEKAADGMDSAMESVKQAGDNVMDSAKESATEAMAAGKDMTQAASDGASAAVVAVKDATSVAAAKTGEVIAAVTGDANKQGEALYKKHCVACHGAGVAGSPKLDDKAAWSARIAQGNAVMTKHAIEGFKGDTGYMPPKGGFMSLSDDDIAATVEYMVSQVK